VGPLFSEETITAENYPNILTEFIALLEKNKWDCWPQQGGVTTHTEKTTAFLHDFFSNHILRLPQFPDPTPPDFFMWGFLKETAYSNSPRNLKGLRRNN
jgi:hypothetical protein